MKTIRYYLAPQSPWTYLGHERLLAIAERHGAVIEPRPIDLGRVFPVSGGLPLAKRAPQRQAYRFVELKRWATLAGRPLNLNPRHFPVDGGDASKLIIAAELARGAPAATTLAGALLRAVWAEERDIADADTLRAIAQESGFDGQALYDAREAAAPTFDRYTQDAIEAQVFGVPWYEYGGEPFWGQDRLDFLDRALAAG